ERYPLEIDDRLAEGFTLGREREGLLEAGPAGAEAQQAQGRAAEVEMVHHPGEPAPLLPDQGVPRHKRAIQVDRTPTQRQTSHAKRRGAGDARRVEWHHEAAHSRGAPGPR